MHRPPGQVRAIWGLLALGAVTAGVYTMPPEPVETLLGRPVCRARETKVEVNSEWPPA